MLRVVLLNIWKVESRRISRGQLVQEQERLYGTSEVVFDVTCAYSQMGDRLVGIHGRLWRKTVLNHITQDVEKAFSFFLEDVHFHCEEKV